MFPTSTVVATITSERLREAETARLARRAVDEQPPQAPRRSRRLRAFATRIAFSAQR